MKLVTSGLVPPSAPPAGLPAELIMFKIESPFAEVPIPVASKAGAAVALATLLGIGNGALTTMVTMMAATRVRAERELKVFNT